MRVWFVSLIVVFAVCRASQAAAVERDFFRQGGRRIANLYEMPAQMVRAERIQRAVQLDEEVADAWVFTASGNNAPTDTARYFINGCLVHTHVPSPRGNTAGAVYKEPIAGFRKGGNEVVIENAKRPFLIVIHLRTGREVLVQPDDSWTMIAAGKSVPLKSVAVSLEKAVGFSGRQRPYGGLIEVVSPGKHMPVFVEGCEIIQEISIPADFYGLEAPVLNFTLRDDWNDRAAAWAAQDLTGKRVGEKIIYTLKLKAHTPGAYTARYSFGPEQGHQRLAEMIIVGAINQKKVPASQIYAGLGKQLVDEIDCAATDDSHPFQDCGSQGARIATAMLTTADGVLQDTRYRETGTSFLHGGALSYMTWQVELKRLNRLYLLEYDYPDNRDRTFTVAVFQDYPVGYGEEVTDICGGEFPLSNTIRTGKLLFYARTPWVDLVVANREAGRRGAVKTFRIYEVTDDRLPMADVSIPAPKLLMGINERGLNILSDMYPGSDVLEFGWNGQARTDYNQLRRLYLAMENLICYIRFCGHNGFMPTSIMYDQRLYPSWDNPDIQTDDLGLLAEMFSANSLNLVVMSHYYLDMRLLTKDWRWTGQTLQRWLTANVTNVVEDEAADLFVLVDNYGKPAPIPDPSHPDIRQSFLDTLQAQLDLYAGYAAFKGLTVFVNGCVYKFGLGFPGNQYGYGDGTMRRFREKYGIGMPAFTGADRFIRRHEWIASNAAPAWVDFKCETMTALFRDAALMVTSANPTAKLFVTPIACDKNVFDSDKPAAWLAETLARNRDVGCDLNALKRLPGAVVVDYLGTGATRKPMVKMNFAGFDWRIHSLDMLDYYFNGGKTAAMLAGGFYESHIKWPEHPVYGKFVKSLIGNAAGAGDHYLHQLNLVMAGLGANYVFDGYIESVLHLGHESAKAKFAEAFAAIPPGDYTRLDGVNQFVAGRVQAEGDARLCYVSNLKAFDTRLRVLFKDAVPAANATRVTDVKTGLSLNLEANSMALELAPYETRIFKCVHLVPIGLADIAPDAEQLAAYERQSLTGDHALTVAARIGDGALVQLQIRNTGAAIEKDVIKIRRHDGAAQLADTYWEYGPLRPGAEQVVTLPGALARYDQTVEGVVHTPNELFDFSASCNGVLPSQFVRQPITIDGLTNDWAGIDFTTLPLHIRAVAGKLLSDPAQIREYPDVDVRFASAWNQDALYLVLEIPDDELIRNKPENPVWSGDGFNLYLDLNPAGDFSNRSYSDDDLELIFAPTDGKARLDEFKTGHSVLLNKMQKQPELLQWKSSVTADGYCLEIRLANEMLPSFRIHPGKAVGFDMRLSDLDSADRNRGYTRYENNRNYAWHNNSTDIWNYVDTSLFGTLLLMPEKGAPSPVATAREAQLDPCENTGSNTLFSCDFEKEMEKEFLPGRTITLRRIKRGDFYHGQYSLELDAKVVKPGADPFILLNRALILPENAVCEVSFWIHAEELSMARLEISDKTNVGDKTPWTQSEALSLQKGWNRYTFIQSQCKNATGKPIEKVAVVLRFYDAGKFVVDDFTVRIHAPEIAPKAEARAVNK